MTAKERVDWVKKYTGLNEYQLAKQIGISPSTINAITTTGRTKEISKNLADKIQSAWPMINAKWLTTGRGNPELARSMEDSLHISKEPDTPSYSRNVAKLIDQLDEKDKQINFLQEQLLLKDRDVVFLQSLIKTQLKTTNPPEP
jgi:DNA-binding XRE family transcriptional regulator